MPCSRRARAHCCCSSQAAVAYARGLQRGEGDAGLLAGVWHDVLHAPHLRPVLRQYDTARRAREAMVHPEDLLALAQGRPRNR